MKRTPDGGGAVSRPRRTLAATMVSTTLSVLPIQFLGALAVFIREDLGFGETQLGATVSVWYAVASLTSVPAGRLAERLGGGRGIMVAALGSATALLGIAGLAGSWIQLVGFIALAAAANAMAHPAVNLALAQGTPRRWHGFVFGIKQASVPSAAFLAGFAVPLVALTVGWRWAYAGAASGAILYRLLAPKEMFTSRGRPRREGRGGNDTALPPLIVLSISGAFAIGASAALTTFYVESSVASGFPAGLAGTWLSLGSVCGILTRIGMGWVADRRRQSLSLVVWLFWIGSFGFVLLASAGSRPSLLFATVVVFASGWGWAGLLQLAIVRLNPDAPAEATGIVMAGMRIGGIFGPFAFGYLVERTSYALAWLVNAGELALAAVLIHVVLWMLRRSRAAEPT